MKLFAIAALVVSGFGVAAQAATFTTYTNRTAYEAAVGAADFFLDFDGLVASGSTGVFAGQVDFNTVGATNPDLVNLNTYVGDTGNPTTMNNVGYLQGLLDNPTYAMGFDVLSGSILGVELFDGAGGSLGEALSFTSGFFGVVSDMAFSRFDVVPRTVTGIGYDRIFIDNFSTNATIPVPLPAGGALLIGGLGLLTLGRKRRG